jgi:hypothetical protein
MRRESKGERREGRGRERDYFVTWIIPNRDFAIKKKR